jgi:hypothetical protein
MWGDLKMATQERSIPEQPLEYGRVTETLTSSVPNQYGIADSAVGQTCFYCGLSVSDPAIHWSGQTGEIYLHPKPCTVALVLRLLRDLHELENPTYYERLKRGDDPAAER